MYGLIGKVTAHPGQREVLAQLLADGLAHRAGCLSYVVALDSASTNAIWVTEVWPDEPTYQASIDNAMVRAFGARIWPLIATMDEPILTEPVGGLLWA